MISVFYILIVFIFLTSFIYSFFLRTNERSNKIIIDNSSETCIFNNTNIMIQSCDLKNRLHPCNTRTSLIDSDIVPIKYEAIFVMILPDGNVVGVNSSITNPFMYFHHNLSDTIYSIIEVQLNVTGITKFTFKVTKKSPFIQVLKKSCIYIENNILHVHYVSYIDKTVGHFISISKDSDKCRQFNYISFGDYIFTVIDNTVYVNLVMDVDKIIFNFMYFNHYMYPYITR
jgi:hypothetical protein